MKIVRERPSEKRYHQVTAPLVVTLPWGERQTSTQWSLGGLFLKGVSGELPQAGDTLSLTLELPFQGFDISFEVSATVTKVEPDVGALGVEFVELTERAHDLLVHFIDDLVRGKMATVEDTICRIDVPVTPISTKPDPEPGDSDKRRWPIKTIIASTTAYVDMQSLTMVEATTATVTFMDEDPADLSFNFGRYLGGFLPRGI